MGRTTNVFAWQRRNAFVTASMMLVRYAASGMLKWVWLV